MANTSDNFVKVQNELKDCNEAEEVLDISTGILQKYGKLAKSGDFNQEGTNAELISSFVEFQTILQSKYSRKLISASVYSQFLLKVILINGKYRQDDFSEDIKQIIRLLNDAELREAIAPSFIMYDDLRCMLLEAIPEIPQLDVQSEDITALSRSLAEILSAVDKKVAVDTDLDNVYVGKVKSLKGLKFINNNNEKAPKLALRYRQAFQKAWLFLLSQNLGDDTMKQVLTVLHARVIPNFTKPQLLMDFIVSCISVGGTVALLALNAVFELVQRHGLDYPDFFAQVYELLSDGSILASAHRSRFLRMLDLFLTSTHLPAAIPAAFCKRLARLSLFAPPGAIVAVVPFIYNQLKRHPNCMVLIHRATESGMSLAVDPYNFEERDPLKCNALESSLWELGTLSHHYHPNVAAIARIMSQPFTKPQYVLEHFLSHSYETLYNTEYNRKRKEPALEFDEVDIFADLSFKIDA